MENANPNAEKKYVPRYYEALGRGHDFLMRCKDCQRLVAFAVLTKTGCCDGCGNRKFIEITVLSEEEYRNIQDGTVRFPDSELFLKEFSPVEAA